MKDYKDEIEAQDELTDKTIAQQGTEIHEKIAQEHRDTMLGHKDTSRQRDSSPKAREEWAKKRLAYLMLLPPGAQALYVREMRKLKNACSKYGPHDTGPQGGAANRRARQMERNRLKAEKRASLASLALVDG